jgi:hypothetical protein
MVEKHFNISIAPVRSRGGSLVLNKSDGDEFISYILLSIYDQHVYDELLFHLLIGSGITNNISFGIISRD